MALRVMTCHSGSPVYAFFKIVFCGHTYIQITPSDTEDWNGKHTHQYRGAERGMVAYPHAHWGTEASLKDVTHIPHKLRGDREGPLWNLEPLSEGLSPVTPARPLCWVSSFLSVLCVRKYILHGLGSPKSSPRLLYVVLQLCLSKNWSWCCQRLEPRWKNTLECCPLDKSMVEVSCSSVPNHLHGG